MRFSKVAILAAAALLTVIAILTIGSFVTFSAFSVVNAAKSVPSSGNVKTTTPNIGVFSNSACTSNLAAIKWGTVTAGASITQTAYIKNTGTGKVTLSLAASNWSPTTASTYITVSWNQQGTQLSAGKSVAATIKLTASSTIAGLTNFTNIITISGTG